MIDSLLGLVMLMLLTGWMASLVSVQSMLSSPARPLTLREQVDLLAAVKSADGSTACADLVSQAKQDDVLEPLQQLLLAPELIARADGEDLAEAMQVAADSGVLPYLHSEELSKLLVVSSAEQVGAITYQSGDWWLQLSKVDASGRNIRERLYLC